MGNIEILESLPPDVVSQRASYIEEIEGFDELELKWGTLKGGFKRPRYTLTYNGVPFAPLGGIHSITGQSGHGKTMTFSLMMAAILGGDCNGLKWNLPDIEPRVLYVDTEMEDENTRLVVARVHTMCGYPLDDDMEGFKWLNLRNVVDTQVRWAMVVKAIDEYRPTVAFLDGNLDLLHNFNQNEECQSHIFKCMRMASDYDMSLWCLVHENPGTQKMVGHLGSMLERKVTDIFEVQKKKEGGVSYFKIQQKKARGKDIEEMVFVVGHDETGLGVPKLQEFADGRDGEEGAGLVLSVEELVGKLFANGETYTTRALLDAVKKLLSCRTSTASEYIENALKSGLIERSRKGRHNAWIYSAVSVPIVPDENIFTNSDEYAPF